MDTIYALSSGPPPAAIAVVRVTGPNASNVLTSLAGSLPPPRRARAATLRDPGGQELDRALVLWLPGPGTATGEDTAEFHLHGGRAVVAAVSAAIARVPGVRAAQPGEFTRRAFTNGRIDLAEAEGLADLLAAETDLQRLAAQAGASGHLSRAVEAWRTEILALSAEVEAVLEFSDEDDVPGLPGDFFTRLEAVVGGISAWLERPRTEALREGFRVVLAGPPNAGKSSLFNALIEDEAAIVAPTPGTTRDLNQRSVALGGTPVTFVDTAGLREGAADIVEEIGIARARGEFEKADLVLWLGESDFRPRDSWDIGAKSDLGVSKTSANFVVSVRTGEGVGLLRTAIMEYAAKALQKAGSGALNARQADLLTTALECLDRRGGSSDPLIAAEMLRAARVQFDSVVGRASTEDMLDALFGRFCIGK